MRVAVLATSYPTSPGDPSGHFVRAEALAFARQGHEVHVFAPSPRLEDGIQAHPCGGTSLLSWPGAEARLRASPPRLLSLAPFASRAIHGLHRVRPDVLYAHWALPCGWPIGSLAAPPALELVSHGADVRLLLRLPSPVRARLVAHLLRARRWRFVASDLRQQLTAALPEPLAERLSRCSFVQPPLVSVSERKAPARRLFPSYAMTLGRMVPGKRTELAIRAVARVDGLGLVLAGDGPERPRLEDLARQLLPGRHQFLGRVDRENALGHLEGALVLLHPSSEEAAPTAVLEALALGVVVFTSGAGDTRAWASQQEGIGVLPPEPQAYTDAIRGLWFSRDPRESSP